MELKEYMAPEMEVILLKMESIVCASDGNSDEIDDVPTTPGGHEPNW